MSRDRNDDCEDLATQRLAYFTGRHMTARDFSDEQSYHRSHRYLHNRMLHGWGVVCGLHVHEHSSATCRNDYVKVDCGLALDCCGREIPVPKNIVPPPIPWLERPAPAAVASDAGKPADAEGSDGNYYPLLCLEYCEKPTELVPVLYNEQACDPQRREHSRVDEGYQFAWHWVRMSDLPTFYWKTRGGGCPDTIDDCKGSEESGHCCLEPRCPPQHCVPLALIRVTTNGPIEDANIVMSGRPALEPPQHALTHICAISWPHGGVVTRADVEKSFRELRVRFDRRLKPPTRDCDACDPDGVTGSSFIVQFGGGFEDLDFVTYEKAPRVENDNVAVFTMDSRKEYGPPYQYLVNQTVYITLKCDFILDCHGVAVDGNHIGGVLPSGDGVRGGTFESWFHVIADPGAQSQPAQPKPLEKEQTT